MDLTPESERVLAQFDGRPGPLEPRDLAAIERAAVARSDQDYARLAENGTVNRQRYHDDPIYHAIVYRLVVQPGRRT